MTKRGALVFLAGFASAVAALAASAAFDTWWEQRHVAEHHSRVYPARGESEYR